MGAMAVLVLLMWQCASALHAGRVSANTLVKEFHHQLNKGKYEEICQNTYDGYNGAAKHDQWLGTLRGVHAKMGMALKEGNGNYRLYASTSGTFLTSEFETTFEHGEAEETLTWIKSKGAWKLFRYQIQSDAFLRDPQQSTPGEQPGAHNISL